jgi:hypothetical protein
VCAPVGEELAQDLSHAASLGGSDDMQAVPPEAPWIAPRQ